MPVPGPFTLRKEERLHSRKLTATLFNGGGSRAMAAFPIRVVYLLTDRAGCDDPQAKMLVSVPKHCFKHAVKRNRVKRQVREAYRKNKHILLDTMAATPDKTVIMAFIWLDNKLRASQDVEKRVCNLLERISERL